jgi:hypothetical protein
MLNSTEVSVSANARGEQREVVLLIATLLCYCCSCAICAFFFGAGSVSFSSFFPFHVLLCVSRAIIRADLPYFLISFCIFSHISLVPTDRGCALS